MFLGPYVSASLCPVPFCPRTYFKFRPKRMVVPLMSRGGHGTFLKYRGTGTGTCLKKVPSVPVLFLKSTAVTVPVLFDNSP